MNLELYMVDDPKKLTLWVVIWFWVLCKF